MSDWMTVVHWFGTMLFTIAVNLPVVPPPVGDVCMTMPLIVTVNTWPKNKGKGRTGGNWTSSETLSVANFLWTPQRLEAVDDRGCMVTITR